MNSRNVELNFSGINLSSLQFVSIPGTLFHEGTIITECPPNDEIVVFLTVPFQYTVQWQFACCCRTRSLFIYIPTISSPPSAPLTILVTHHWAPPGQDTGQRTVSENISGIDIEMQFDQFLSLQPTPTATTYSTVHVETGYCTDGPCWSGMCMNKNVRMHFCESR